MAENIYINNYLSVSCSTIPPCFHNNLTSHFSNLVPIPFFACFSNLQQEQLIDCERTQLFLGKDPPWGEITPPDPSFPKVPLQNRGMEDGDTFAGYLISICSFSAGSLWIELQARWQKQARGCLIYFVRLHHTSIF